MGGGHLLETGHKVVERTLLGSTVGLVTLGLYAHSEQYRNLVQVGLKALARSIWPISLREARVDRYGFDLTNRAWRAAAIAVASVGILAAFLAGDVIALLTHDKFTNASPYVALWMAYVLIQNMGKPQSAALFSAQKGVALGWIGQGTRAFGILLLFVLVPTAGILGAFIALAAQQLAMRILLHVYAHKVGATPFQDRWIVIGCGIIGIALTIALTANLSLASRIVLSVGFLFVLALSGQSVVRDVFAFARKRVAVNP
jgi:O-antigen/teichoic acid export membrane protein